MIPVLLCVLGLTQAQADPEKRIRVELELGKTYAVALGQDASAKAKQLAEAALVDALGEKVKYFSFVPSSQSGTHTLTFRIDHPTPDLSHTGISLFDYYVFLDFKKNNSNVQHTLHWLFRDAASSLNGVDTPETIAENLSKDIRSRHDNSIIKEMLSKVSFTEKARFKFEGAKGWIIDHSRHSLCMAPDSEIVVESIVPPEGFEEKYGAEVKRRQSGDDVSTFTKATDDVDELMAAPENARVVAVYVINYEAECENTLVESSPEMVSFGEGGVQ
jgi:hypothetical protein